ncbi:MAG TPA: methyltransferase domain-containing protein [Cellvibrionaceae bacterium]
MYLCPVCQTSLTRQQQSYGCSNGHSFDIARKGYVNLLLPHQMNSRTPGDNAMMVAARRDFLSAGFYQPLVDAIAALANQYGVQTLLDAGCGEGYYACALEQSGLTVAGVDISKPAITAACGRNKAMPWCVASVAALPYEAGYFDTVLSVFCFASEAEFARVLIPGGYLFSVGPGDNHLPALRQGLYQQVRDYQTEKQQDYFAEAFEPVDTLKVQFAFNVQGEHIENLLKMTPHYWHAAPEQQAALLAQTALDEQADFVIRLYRKRA